MCPYIIMTVRFSQIRLLHYSVSIHANTTICTYCFPIIYVKEEKEKKKRTFYNDHKADTIQHIFYSYPIHFPPMSKTKDFILIVNVMKCSWVIRNHTLLMVFGKGDVISMPHEWFTGC